MTLSMHVPYLCSICMLDSRQAFASVHSSSGIEPSLRFPRANRHPLLALREVLIDRQEIGELSTWFRGRSPYMDNPRDTIWLAESSIPAPIGSYVFHGVKYLSSVQYNW
jgi:hypothetical protein